MTAIRLTTTNQRNERQRRSVYFTPSDQRWASLLKNVTSLSVTTLLKKLTSLSVTPLQKVTEVIVTPLLRYFYKIKSQKRCKGIDDAAATN